MAGRGAVGNVTEGVAQGGEFLDLLINQISALSDLVSRDLKLAFFGEHSGNFGEGETAGFSQCYEG